MSFKDLGISDEYSKALRSNMKIRTPTPVQKETIPLILEEQNVMVQSKTGTGKTIAFILPILDKLKGVRGECLILLPTRELAKQVHNVITEIGNGDISSMTVYGGVSIHEQIKKIKKGAQIIVGTPGRIIDLYKRRKLKFKKIRFVVLDEADRLWDMGFAPDIKYILRQIKTDYQFMLFSATLNYDMRELVKKYSKERFEFINLSRDDMTVGNTLQFYYLIDLFEQKYNTFVDILRRERPNHALVFVNTRKTADWLSRSLKKDRRVRSKVGTLSGGMTQYQREKMLKKFRKRKINMLVATDVAARGLDIDDISHVFNYDVPHYPEVYVHRIGRTSRMNKRGVAITLVLKDEYVHLCNIEGLINKEIRKRETRFQRKKRKRFTIY
ncbi:MAG: DEAD/DEAH box helicase [Promethearchaeota archaeon]|nr:MAG: DEAD/DEAH box helicase [Candidatus Lokiarchaeota archaeon]